ncbi:MAG: winged helix-turn-helix transcriptional regulator [Saprospiraceae bacterium]|nr:winged helix-turn-helix transcriptional regulator [Saprospiraceae bacterium]
MRDTKVVINSQKLDYSCELMRALAHPLRLKILTFIDSNKEINVNQIYNALDLEQSLTSQHLKVLRMAGVLSVEKAGKFMKYTINYDVLEKAQYGVSRFMAAI